MLTTLFVYFKWTSIRNSLTTHLSMVICMHYLAQVYSKLTQGHFLQTFTLFRKCHFKDYTSLDKSFLEGAVFDLAFLGWEKGLTSSLTLQPFQLTQPKTQVSLFHLVPILDKFLSKMINCRSWPTSSIKKRVIKGSDKFVNKKTPLYQRHAIGFLRGWGH